eukprot:556419-Prorocentrum_lima.AAC.1
MGQYMGAAHAWEAMALPMQNHEELVAHNQMLELHAALWLSVAKLENWARLMQVRAHEFNMTQAQNGERDSPSNSRTPTGTGSPTA